MENNSSLLILTKWISLPNIGVNAENYLELLQAYQINSLVLVLVVLLTCLYCIDNLHSFLVYV